MCLSTKCTTVHLRTYDHGLTASIEDMHQYCSNERKKHTNMRMVGASGTWRRKPASGAGRAWAAALVEGAGTGGSVTLRVTETIIKSLKL
jgi:hypothetical protein